jgi:hypothetical protein
MPSTGYNAAISSNDVSMSYAPEAAWGVKPAVAFQQLRMDSEGFTQTKGRGRPSEINPSGQVSAAVTQKVETKGDLKFSLSNATPFDMLAASIMGTPLTAVNIAASTIAAVADGFTDSGNGFITGNVTAGSWLRVRGFTGTGGINGLYQVLSVVAGKITTLPAPPATKVVGDPITINGQKVLNANVFQSFFIQKMLSSSLFLQYPGAWPTSGGVSGATGGFFSGDLTFLAQDQLNVTADGSTGAQLVAASGDVFNTTTGFGAVYRGAAALTAKIQKIDLKWQGQSAAAQLAMGSAAAQGMRKGLLDVNGSVDLYFKDFNQYTEYLNETKSMLSFSACDVNGAGFVFTLANATLMDPKIVAGGPNQDVMASFTVEGNPSSAGGLFGGATLQIDKIV